MSNIILNATLALIEDRPEAAREMLRDPSMRGKSFGIMARFEHALADAKDKAICEALRKILRQSMALEPQDMDEANVEAYYKGITEVENLLQKAIEYAEATAVAPRVPENQVLSR